MDSLGSHPGVDCTMQNPKVPWLTPKVPMVPWWGVAAMMSTKALAGVVSFSLQFG